MKLDLKSDLTLSLYSYNAKADYDGYHDQVLKGGIPKGYNTTEIEFPPITNKDITITHVVVSDKNGAEICRLERDLVVRSSAIPVYPRFHVGSLTVDGKQPPIQVETGTPNDIEVIIAALIISFILGTILGIFIL